VILNVSTAAPHRIHFTVLLIAELPLMFLSIRLPTDAIGLDRGAHSAQYYATRATCAKA
jgi:hypothetical protein